MKVVVGVAPAVAGQDAQHQVDTAGQADHDDVGGRDGEAQLIMEKDDYDQLDDLDEEIEHVDEDDTLLSLPVRVFLVSRLQGGVLQATGEAGKVDPVHLPPPPEHRPLLPPATLHQTDVKCVSGLQKSICRTVNRVWDGMY